LTYFATQHFGLSKEISEGVAILALDDEIIAAIGRALSEDIGTGDVTTNGIVRPHGDTVARIIAKQDGILSGLTVAQAVFLSLDGEMRFSTTLLEGAHVRREQILLELEGSARAILTGERTALNFLGRMSGIATLTRQFVDAIKGTNAVVLDTRKTAPGLRASDKQAVKHGGGQNHRFGLYDLVLIKDNHIDYAGSLSNAVRLVRERGHALEIEVEARSIQEVNEALALGVKQILLDNMSIADLRQAVAISAGQAKLEASGNVTLTNVREIAETGVDFISVGALTHSAKAFDVSLLWVD
jgi:nicotinate-nucleotide pyrophosphorylase (carboxylating)